MTTQDSFIERSKRSRLIETFVFKLPDVLADQTEALLIDSGLEIPIQARMEATLFIFSYLYLGIIFSAESKLKAYQEDAALEMKIKFYFRKTIPGLLNGAIRRELWKATKIRRAEYYAAMGGARFNKKADGTVDLPYTEKTIELYINLLFADSASRELLATKFEYFSIMLGEAVHTCVGGLIRPVQHNL